MRENGAKKPLRFSPVPPPPLFLQFIPDLLDKQNQNNNGYGTHNSHQNFH
jgi:hypothetical protein